MGKCAAGGEPGCVNGGGLPLIVILMQIQQQIPSPSPSWTTASGHGNSSSTQMSDADCCRRAHELHIDGAHLGHGLLPEEVGPVLLGRHRYQ